MFLARESRIIAESRIHHDPAPSIRDSYSPRG